MPKLIYNNKDNAFFQSLKKDVDGYFKTNNISKTGDWRLHIKTIVLVSVAVAAYLLLMLVKMPALPALGLCVVAGFFMACIGFSIMHDANHGSYSPNNKINDLLGLSANFLGASAYFWKQKHNIIHHTYTNVDGLDDDIAKSPVIRQCESQKWVPAHKVQHLYLPLVYALSVLFWIFIMDFTKYFTRKIYTTEAWKLTLKNHIIFWVTKVYYITTFMVIPIMVWGVGAWAIGYLVLNAVIGSLLAYVFQLAHVVEKTEFESIAIDETKHLETAWAEHELRTTCNFAMNNKVISWFVGGLNYQIEHHLFPKVSHVHYPAISKIIEAKCVEYNMPYNKYDTMWEALQSHFRLMRDLGKSEQYIASTKYMPLRQAA